MSSRYDPWADLGQRYGHVEVQQRDLDGYDGWLDIDAAVIVLERRLTQTRRRCTLAHEIAHLDRGDRCTWASYPDAVRLDLRMERAAHSEGARRLIEARDLCHAFAVHGEAALDNVADELWVDLDTLLARLDNLHPTERGLVRRAIERREDVA